MSGNATDMIPGIRIALKRYPEWVRVTAPLPRRGCFCRSCHLRRLAETRLTRRAIELLLPKATVVGVRHGRGFHADWLYVLVVVGSIRTTDEAAVRRDVHSMLARSGIRYRTYKGRSGGRRLCVRLSVNRGRYCRL